ncbi:uncharacterized protein LOC118220975 [Anguilla anguilla]|uniref:uncharacterized protein LOC118220975 n=1 Tax=Anguilla anguilla TaxID=7936 RepID=UPI0015ACD7C8|nr:uncharacterized protein LOC118220975 [Anguilla anguilla]
MNSLLPDNKSWINRKLQKNMCKLLLQAAILAIHLPVTCATGQCSCNVYNHDDKEEAFCTSNEECGFEKDFPKGICIITKTSDSQKTTPRPNTSTSQASRDDTNKEKLKQGNDSVTNNTDDRPTNSGASTGEGAITGIVLGVLAIVALVVTVIYCCTKRPSRPGGQHSRAQSDGSELSLRLLSPLTTPTMLLPPTGAVETAQPIRTMAIISEQEGHGTELGAEPGEEMGEEVGVGQLEKLDGAESRSRSSSVTSWDSALGLPPPSEPSDLSSSRYSTLTLDELQQGEV